MPWITRKTIRINRSATAWLIRRFIDPAATSRFVTADALYAHLRARLGAAS